MKLRMQGGVSVNGTMLARATVLVSGDRVTTTDNSSGTITAPGSTINVAPKSSAIYGGGNAEMIDGGASVVTSSGTSGKVGNLTVSPVDAKAKYDFGQRGNKIIIAALEGKLRISDGRQQMMLDAGKALEIPSDSNDSQGNATHGGWMGLSNGVAIGIAAGVAALGIGLGLGLANANTLTSASSIR
jgi:hypothetical protein